VRQGSPGRGPVWIEDRVIHVAGAREHHPRRVLDFLKSEARKELEMRVTAHTSRIGLKHTRLTVRDTASRWGSCSAQRSLSFSWRLILAPPFVLDYVVAHEVAHMREMNHGPKFWKLVQELVGDFRRPQKWLRDHGPALHRYAAKS
jgi:predicted metal-dependent hydrolase